MTFVWEPVAEGGRRRLRHRRSAGAHVSVIAAGADGTPYFRGRVPEAASASTSPGGSVTFEAPAGSLQLRLSVEGAASNIIDTDMREVAVPDLTAPQTQLSTPQIFRARTPRELQQIKADPKAVQPSAANSPGRIVCSCA